MNNNHYTNFEYKVAFFDFDYTIINANSNNYLNKLAIEHEEALKDRSCKSYTPSISTLNKYKYSTDIEQLLDRNDMTLRQNAIYKHMHVDMGLKRDSMEKCLGEILISESMKQLFAFLVQNNFESVIISDSNTFLIETILRKNNLIHFFEPIETKILANRGVFDEFGCLNVIPLNKEFCENGAIFTCENTNFCRKNICKGEVIEKYLLKSNKAQLKRRCIYVGDGKIDFCPATKLEISDKLFVKSNSSLSKLLTDEGLKEKVKSDIIFWKNAKGILRDLQTS